MSACKKNCSCSRSKPCGVPVSKVLKGIDVCQIPNLCIPRTGELIINGGFENPQTFFGWKIDPNNDGVEQAGVSEVHSGQKAASLGFENQQGNLEGNGILFQDVLGICPGKHYELQFEMNGDVQKGNAPVDVRVIWLDGNKNMVGLGLQITVTEDSLPDDVIGAWTTFQGVTNAAPPQTQFARVQFEIHAGNPIVEHIHLDDVSFKLL